MSSLEDRFQKEEEDFINLSAKLRDQFMLYNEMTKRYAVNIESEGPFKEQKAHKTVYFSVPDTVFVKDPELQKNFRKELIEKLAEVPRPGTLPLYPDLLHKEFMKETKDRSCPSKTRAKLAKYYKHRVTYLESKRFKILQRWAHFCKESETLDRVSIALNGKLGRLQTELDLALNRFERLNNEDEILEKPSRPIPVTEEGNNMFSVIPSTQFSNIARDDFEVYFRWNIYRNQVNRPIMHFIHRLKVIQYSHRHSIWARSQQLIQTYKQQAITRVISKTGNEDIGNEEVKETIYANVNIKNIKRQMAILKKLKMDTNSLTEVTYNKNEQLMTSWKDEFDFPPVLIDNYKVLKNVLDVLGSKYQIIGDIETDDGHSFVYQVNMLLPIEFNFQKLRSEWQVYDADPEERDLPALKYSNLSSLRVSNLANNLRRTAMKSYDHHMLNTTMSSGVDRNIDRKLREARVTRLKPADWVACVKLFPMISVDQRRQDAKFLHMDFIDRLLDLSFQFIEVNDLPTVNKKLDSQAEDYNERAKKRSLLKNELGVTETELTKRLFTNLVTKGRDRIISETESTFTKDDRDRELVQLPTHCIKGLYTLKLLEAREHRLKLLDILNVYRSIQRRLTIDVRDAAQKTKISPETETIDPSERQHGYDEQEKRTEHNAGVKVKLDQKSQTVSSTCPILPSVHALHARSFETEPTTFHGLAARRDKIDATDDGIYVTDEFGINIFYDCVKDDYKALTSELLKIGSFYIQKFECMMDTDDVEQLPSIDRDFLVVELLEYESNFQKAKFDLLMLYLDVYENTIDPVEQIELAQYMTTLMSIRPRFELEASYFINSYNSHIASLKAHKSFLAGIIQFQTSHEKEVLKHMMERQQQAMNNSTTLTVDREYIHAPKSEEPEIPVELVERSVASEFAFIRYEEGYPDEFVRVEGLDKIGNSRESPSMALLDVYESLAKIGKIWKVVDETLLEISEIQKTETPINLNALETAIWEQTYIEWKNMLAYLSDRPKDKYYTTLAGLKEGVLLDNPGALLLCVNEVTNEVNNASKKSPHLLPKLQANWYTDQKKLPPRELDLEIPSELQLYCNMFNVYNTREILIRNMEECAIIAEIYRSQKVWMKKEGMMDFAEGIRFESDAKFNSQVEEGPGSNLGLSLAAYEFDPKLSAKINFGSLEAVKMLLLPTGLQELQAVTSYQVMQKQLILMAVQTHQYAFDSWSRQLEEIRLAHDYGYIPRNHQANWKHILGQKGEGIVQEQYVNEEKRLTSRFATEASKYQFDIIQKKGEYRNEVGDVYAELAKKHSAVLEDRHPEQLSIVLRNLRVKLLHGYVKQTLRKAYYEAIKIQSIKVSQQLKHEVAYIPDPESAFSISVFKENARNEEHKTERKLFNEFGVIDNVFHIPSVEEILSQPGASSEELLRYYPNWEPYFMCETPDVFEKRIRQTLLYQKPKDEVKHHSSLDECKDQSWKFQGKTRNMLEVLVCQLRTLQIKLFLNELNSPVHDVLEVQDKIKAGDKVWANVLGDENDPKEDRKVDFSMSSSAAKVGEEAVEKLLEDKGRKIELSEDITRAVYSMQEIRLWLNEQSNENKLDLLIDQYRLNYQALALGLYQLYHYCLTRQNEFACLQVLNFLTELTSMNRTAFSLHGNPISLNSVSPIDNEAYYRFVNTERAEEITLMNNLTVHNDPKKYRIMFNGFIPDAKLRSLDWGLLNLNPADRAYAVANYTAMQIRADQYISTKQLTKIKQPLEALSTQIQYYSTHLEWFRLRNSLFVWKSKKDFTIDSVYYEKMLNDYRDSIEWKTQYEIRKEKYGDRELGKIKSENSMMRQEFHRMLIVLGINYLDQELTALVSASESKNEFGITQEFTCNFDRNSLDITRKISTLHNFFNTLRNRCTSVDTPTCGTSLVFSIRDLSYLAQRFASNLIRFAETEFRYRVETSSIQNRQLHHVIYCKERKIKALESDLSGMKEQMDKVVNTRVSEKGNQIIYELDTVSRQLRELKTNMSLIEDNMRDLLSKEFNDRVRKAEKDLADAKHNFSSFREEITSELKADVNNEKTAMLKNLKDQENGKNDMYEYANKKVQKLNVENCEEEIHESESRDIRKMGAALRKMRIVHHWAKIKMQQQYQQQIHELKEQLTSNQALWEQLSDAQRREKLLHSELSYTQQALAASEKLADKLQAQIENMNNQRLRLQQYKLNKGKRLAELENRIKKYKRLENVDTNRMLNQLMQHNKKLQVLEKNEMAGELKLIEADRTYQKRVKMLERKLKTESKLKEDAFRKLEIFREEMHGMDHDQDSIASIWKGKCEEMVYENRNLQDENALLKEKLEQLGAGEFLATLSHTSSHASDRMGHVMPPIKSSDRMRGQRPTPPASRGHTGSPKRGGRNRDYI